MGPLSLCRAGFSNRNQRERTNKILVLVRMLGLQKVIMQVVLFFFLSIVTDKCSGDLGQNSTTVFDS